MRKLFAVSDPRLIIPFDNSYARLPPRFHLPQQPSSPAQPKLIAFNRPLAAELGLDLEAASETDLADYFSGNRLPEGAAPLAMAYAGHQFGHFVPTLGDGRAILLGEVIDRKGRRRDIQLKGAGQTPFSRRGDGRAALGPVLREYIVSEAMHALGVPTTRALAAIATGQPVYRETVLPGAVFTRVAASHIRIGTFQYFAARQDTEALKRLADHVIERHDPDLKGADKPYAALLARIIDRQAALIARWMGIGFIHGVMNTDNMTVSGETIDFGPCAFLDEFDPGKTFSSIDQNGRYAYQNQPSIGQWNLTRLAETFLPLLNDDEDSAIAEATGLVVDFAHRFNAHWLQTMGAKIGLDMAEDDDRPLIEDFLGILRDEAADFTLAFRMLANIVDDVDEIARQGLVADKERISAWRMRWLERLGRENRDPAMIAVALRAANPALIARNHQIEAVIAAAIERDDFAPFHRLNRALSRPFDDDPAYADLAMPPNPAERVQATFCGT